MGVDADHYFLKPAVEKALGVTVTPQGDIILGPDTVKLLDYFNQLRIELDVAKLANQELLTRLTTQAQLQAQTAQLLHLVIGGDAVAQNLVTLYALLQANLAGDVTTAADLLTKISEVRTLASTATTSVQLVRNVADQALATTQTQATTLVDQGQKIAANTLSLAGKLNQKNGIATALTIATESKDDEAAVRMSQLKGGLRRPYFVLKNVGTQPVLADTVVINPFNEQLTFQPTSITAFVITRPLLAATLTVSYVIGTGAPVVFFTRTVALTDIPVVGAVLIVLVPGAVMNEIPIGARIQAVTSAGVFKFIIDGLLQ